MKEIKFRGQLLDSDKWMYGYYVKHLISLDKEDNAVYKHFIVETTVDNTNSDIHTYLTYHRVKPKTVGQYIDLKDKNNKEIYEGDVVEWIEKGSSFKGYIYSKKGGFFVVGNIEERILFLLDRDLDKCGNRLKVIGNKYENPELLKEAKDELEN